MYEQQQTAPARQSVASQLVTTVKLIIIMGALGLVLWLLDRWLVAG